MLPGVMGIEAFAEVAALPLPGWHARRDRGRRVPRAVQVLPREPRTLTITATFRPEGDQLVADCRLVGSRRLANQAEPQVTTHFTGRVRLAGRRSRTRSPSGAPAPDGEGTTADAIYGVYFHGPAYQVLERAWRSEQGPVGLLASDLPADHVPAERPEVARPA